MNILYISNLSGNLFAGPNISIPAQIKAQAKVDNVFWYNVNPVRNDEWIVLGCVTKAEYPTERLNDLPEPFNSPDIVVFEEFYCFPFSRIIRDVKKARIPYIIIPRSALTENAQKRKRIKKVIGNALFFWKFAKDAALIQYLTKQEELESGKKWNKKSLIIPNGTETKSDFKQHFNIDSIHAVYIGRYEKYQKGLDILIAAISVAQRELRERGFVLNMYGVDQEGTAKLLANEIDKAGISDIVILNSSVYGDDKKAVLLESDVFIMTSRFEGMPMGMIEALSYGLPCFATKGTNLAEEINDFDAGWAADNTIESVKMVLIQMVDSVETLPTKGKNAINLANNFLWENIAKICHEQYLNILKVK